MKLPSLPFVFPVAHPSLGEFNDVLPHVVLSFIGWSALFACYPALVDALIPKVKEKVVARAVKKWKVKCAKKKNKNKVKDDDEYMTKTRAGEQKVVDDALADMYVRLNGIAHALVVSYGAIVGIRENGSVFFDDIFFATSDTSKLFCVIACGYFFWDLAICIKYGWGFAFVGHAVSCIIAYVLTLGPFSQNFAMMCLLFELSTPLLHARWFFINTDRTDSALWPLVNYGFVFTFFFARIVFGWPLSIDWQRAVWTDLLSSTSSTIADANATAHALFCSFSNAFLCLLNVYWMFLMVRAAVQGGNKTASDEKPKDA